MSGHTPKPWYWLGDHSLVGGHGKRPVVLTGAYLRQRSPATGLLVPLDPSSPDAMLMAAAPDLKDALAHALASHAAGFKCHVCGSVEVDCWLAEAKAAHEKAKAVGP